jgi:hypothetical protein
MRFASRLGILATDVVSGREQKKRKKWENNVNRVQLEHIIRASGEIAGVQDVIILGSQSILGQFPDLDDPLFRSDCVDDSLREMSQKILLRSIEADVMIPDDEEIADLIDGAIGELSPFHHTHGYYAQGVDSTTVLLPEGWEKRLILVCNDNTNNVRGYCLEIHDLVLSKLYAGRQKDLDFFHAAIHLQLITKEILLERLVMSPISNKHKDIMKGYIKRGFQDE